MKLELNEARVVALDVPERSVNFHARLHRICPGPLGRRIFQHSTCARVYFGGEQAAFGHPTKTFTTCQNKYRVCLSVKGRSVRRAAFAEPEARCLGNLRLNITASFVAKLTSGRPESTSGCR